MGLGSGLFGVLGDEARDGEDRSATATGADVGVEPGPEPFEAGGRVVLGVGAPELFTKLIAVARLTGLLWGTTLSHLLCLSEKDLCPAFAPGLAFFFAVDFAEDEDALVGHFGAHHADRCCEILGAVMGLHPKHHTLLSTPESEACAGPFGRGAVVHFASFA